jgi:hypothetical protein
MEKKEENKIYVSFFFNMDHFFQVIHNGLEFWKIFKIYIIEDIHCFLMYNLIIIFIFMIGTII